MKDYSLSNWKVDYEDLPKKEKKKFDVSDNFIENVEAFLAVAFVALICLVTYFWLMELAINAGITVGSKL